MYKAPLLLLHKRLSPPNHLFVHRPRQRTADSLPPNPQTQPSEHAPHAFFPQHHPRGFHHIAVLGRHELQPRLDRIERVRERCRRHRSYNAGDEVRTRCARRCRDV